MGRTGGCGSPARPGRLRWYEGIDAAAADARDPPGGAGRREDLRRPLPDPPGPSSTRSGRRTRPPSSSTRSTGPTARSPSSSRSCRTSPSRRPARGTVRAEARPVVVPTVNRTRDLHEALRRRCVYHFIDDPDARLESDIVTMRASSVARATADAVVAPVNRLRGEPLAEPPGVAGAGRDLHLRHPPRPGHRGAEAEEPGAGAGRGRPPRPGPGRRHPHRRRPRRLPRRAPLRGLRAGGGRRRGAGQRAGDPPRQRGPHRSAPKDTRGGKTWPSRSTSSTTATSRSRRASWCSATTGDAGGGCRPTASRS